MESYPPKSWFVCIFLYAEPIGWYEEEFLFPDYETAYCYAEIEVALVDGVQDMRPEDIRRILEFRIVEVPHKTVFH